jgi:hypothetical protein
MTRKWIAVTVALVVCGVIAEGCALLFVGAIAGGAAAGTVSYVGNGLRVVQEVSIDKAWSAAYASVNELQFPVISDKSYKDATGALLLARNAKDQIVRVQLIRQSDRLTEIRLTVGRFDTAANRATAQLVYDKMKAKM